MKAAMSLMQTTPRPFERALMTGYLDTGADVMEVTGGGGGGAGRGRGGRGVGGGLRVIATTPILSAKTKKKKKRDPLKNCDMNPRKCQSAARLRPLRRFGLNKKKNLHLKNKEINARTRERSDGTVVVDTDSKRKHAAKVCTRMGGLLEANFARRREAESPLAQEPRRAATLRLRGAERRTRMEGKWPIVYLEQRLGTGTAL